MGDGGRAGALRVWEKERNEMTTGEGRAFPWFALVPPGLREAAGRKRQAAARPGQERERETTPHLPLPPKGCHRTYSIPRKQC